MIKQLAKKVKIKKLFLGYISIRDYLVEKAIEKKQGIVVDFGNKQMTIPYDQLTQRFQFHRQNFQSKFSNKKYELIDFKWRDDR